MQQLSIPQTKEFVRHVAVRNREPVMLWGSPGVGKSMAMVDLAADLGAQLVDIRLSQYASVDLRGMPDISEDTTMWKVPSTIPFQNNKNFSDEGLIILFLDEINAADKPVSAVAYQLVNDRRVGEHVLRDNVVIVAAGNRETDKGITNRQPLPLSNRFTHAEVVIDVDAWCQWALEQGYPPITVAFMQFRKDLLNTFDPTKNVKNFATPRTWAKTIKYYMDAEMPKFLRDAAMVGAVGGPAIEFVAFEGIWKSMPDIQDIITNPDTAPMPTEVSMTYAITVALSGAMNRATTGAIYKYLKRLTPEFMVLAWQLAARRDATVLHDPAFVLYSKDYKAILE